MKINFVRHESGQIVEWGVMDEEAVARLASENGWTYVEGVGEPGTHHVDNGTIVERPAFEFADQEIIADDTDEATFHLPVEATVTIDGSVQTVPAGDLSFTAADPGTYTLAFEAFPYIAKTVKVTAHAP